jgi:Bacterial PH domain
VWLAFVVANVVDVAVQGVHGSSVKSVLVVAAILATVTGLVYALALRPRVIADQDGLAIVNPFRDHRVPWAVIQTVEVGDWVRVHYSTDAGAPSSASGKSVSCWALYISARAKRNAARPPRPPRRSWLRPSVPAGIGVDPKEPGYAEGDSRLPEEARYLASLPAAKAIAARLDARAGKERARAARSGPSGPVTARWAWLPVAAVAVPALALLIAVLA